MRNHALDPANWLAKLQSLKPSCAVPANSGVNTFLKDSEFRSGRHHPYMFILHCLLHDSTRHISNRRANIQFLALSTTTAAAIAGYLRSSRKEGHSASSLTVVAISTVRFIEPFIPLDLQD